MKHVAIKEIQKIETKKENIYTTIKLEKDIFNYLSNTNCDEHHIIKCYYEYFETPNSIYFIMENIQNGNLKTLYSTPQSEQTLNTIAKQILTAVSFLHSNNIIHRDIKLSNIMVSKSKTISIKVIDFGLSKVIGNNDVIYENCGTLLFKAPELIIGSNYSFSVDIWSVGICLFYLLFKRFPIEESDKHLLKQKIIRDNFMEDFIQKGITSAKYATQVIFQCLVKEPNKRKNVYEII